MNTTFVNLPNPSDVISSISDWASPFFNAYLPLMYVAIGIAIACILGVFLIVLFRELNTGRLGNWIWNGGLGTNDYIRNFGRPPWKGYNRWRSPKWNMEHAE